MRAEGYLEIFEKAGARVIEPSCGACINAGPGVSTRPDQVVISAQNRNFPGRSGPGQMYLASPVDGGGECGGGLHCGVRAQREGSRGAGVDSTTRHRHARFTPFGGLVCAIRRGM